MTKAEMIAAIELAENAMEEWDHVYPEDLPPSANTYLETRATLRQRPVNLDGSYAWYPADVIDIIGMALHDTR